MSDVGKRTPKEYSDQFDKLRQNRVEVSYHKYGPAEINYKEKLVDALKSSDMCVEKYKKTGNTEYLCDTANYLMFEFMYPQVPGAYFKATDSLFSFSGKENQNYETGRVSFKSYEFGSECSCLFTRSGFLDYMP